MNKELVDKLVEKILKYLEKYPIETWEESPSLFSMRYYISHTKKLELGVSGTDSDYITIRLYNDDKSYQYYEIYNDRLLKILKEESKRRRENLLLECQRKKRETLCKFLEEDF
jgi:hypothetical protein